MAEPVRIWLGVSHHAAFRVAGWAVVRADEAGVSGFAGGERRLDAERGALLALLAALKDLPAGRSVVLTTSDAIVAGFPARMAAAQAGGEAPADNLDLWAALSTALAAREVKIVQAAAAPGTPPGTPLAFAAAWAEFGRERAKDKGPFTASIPKPNLAKAGV
ncbi:ribonuclease H [Phenylobacterium soli]|uniref:ribonuclease H n=1 Tax=Phenylobacterium soli TaxID=2170551 RepID=UPI001057F813|nr:ribonuclease H [Phenylobacterium soli]